MILEQVHTDAKRVRIMARGNFSLGGAHLLHFLLALALVTLGLAGLLAMLGYWPILMIAALQLTLVCAILVRAWQQAWIQEVIEISPNEIRVRHQQYKRVRECRLQTAWAVVEWQAPEFASHEPALRLRAVNTSVELGRFLTEAEKRQLAIHLRNAIEKHSALQSAFNF